jgi:predicted SnoaL-like aldol condensation-catalyzing enzyme
LSPDTAQETSAKKVALDFFQEAFINKDPEKAVREHMGETYTQHNPLVGDGAESFVPAINGMLGQFPDFWIEVKRVIAEGDLVVIHSHVKMTKDDVGNAVADIFRVTDGKIVEHWDIIQAIPAESANNNTMF